MNIAEWPLVIFTLLIQWAVGLLIVSELAVVLTGQAGRTLLRGRDIVVLVLGVAGLVFSFAHLGTPTHSPFAIFNIGSSWLSREILGVGFFLGCVTGLVLSRRMRIFAPLAGLAAVVSCLAGIVAMLAMVKVYLIVTVPGWNSPATALSFVGSALLLGALATGVLASLRWAGGGAAVELAAFGKIMGLVLTCALLGVAAKLIELPFLLADGGTANARGVSALSAVMSAGVFVQALRLLLLLVGIALFVYATSAVRTTRVATLPLLGLAPSLQCLPARCSDASRSSSCT